jgi:hypothetical protein
LSLAVLLRLLLASQLGFACGAESLLGAGTFLGTKAGDEISVGGVKLCWCPAGKFIMGSQSFFYNNVAFLQFAGIA